MSRIDQRSGEAKAYRGWYGLKGWLSIRSRRLDTDPLCVMCKAEGRVTAACIVDHIKPHRGDRKLFFSFENTQSLCKPHHDGPKQREERLGRAIGCDANGWPLGA